MFFSTKKSELDIITQFAHTNYPDLQLEPEMLEQLLWLQNNSINTSQANVQAVISPVDIEVKRILSRLNCFKLLETGDIPSYQKFIDSQPDNGLLSPYNFERLSHFIQKLSPASRKALMATCFITKSDQASLEISPEERLKVPADSEQYITYMVTNHPTIFPICRLLTPEELNLLPFAFYKNAHARQILDMEGGYNMGLSIAKARHNGDMNDEQYHLWFARWIINISGLEGHINPKGSIYLTDPLADCIFALKLELDQLKTNPDYPVIDHYLQFRAAQLNVDDPYIAYFGALMRKYTPSVGQKIQAWFSCLTPEEQEAHQATFIQQLTNTKVTPSFKPTVLVNLLDLKCTISEALTLFTQIELHAMQIYTDAVANGEISETTPLSFRDIANKKLLSPILDYYTTHQILPQLNIDSSGYLTVTPAALLNTSYVYLSALQNN